MKKLFMPLNIQFFADGGEGGQGEGSPSGTSNSSAVLNSGNGGNIDISAVIQNALSVGAQNVLNAMGYKTLDEAVAATKKNDVSAGGDNVGSDADEKKEKERLQLEQRALAAESKLACIVAGVNKESMDDVLAIAAQKIEKDKPLDKVLEEMKKEKKYASFFADGVSGADDEGTGSNQNNARNPNPSGSKFGEVLAKHRNENNTKKSSFFA